MDAAQPHRTGPWTDPVIIGVAGAIGAGKSAMAQAFRRQGFLVLDFDRLAREKLDHPHVIRTLVDWWGEDILDDAGLVRRDAVAHRIFASDHERVRLEALIHPLVHISAEQARQLARDASAPGVVLDAPLLFEAGFDAECDVVVFVDAPRTLRERRVRDHRGWDAGELARRERAQWTPARKRARSRFVVENTRDIAHLDQHAARILAALRDAPPAGDPAGPNDN